MSNCLGELLAAWDGAEAPHRRRIAETYIRGVVFGGPEAGTGTECSADCMAIPG